jgi:glutaconate CoA-transferase subunit B
MLRQNLKSFVSKLDFLTSAGFLEGGASRDRLKVPGRGPQAVITDLGVLEPDAESKELVLTQVHRGVEVAAVVDATGWPLRVASAVGETDPPTDHELEILRELKPSEGAGIAELVEARRRAIERETV